MKNFFFYLTTLFLLISCNSEHETLVITFEEAAGLSTGQPVLIKGLQIGEVTKISLSHDYDIDVEILLNDSIRLPNDSKFTMENVDIFNKGIVVTPGKSKTYYKRSDKIIGSKFEPVPLGDSIIQKFEKELIESIHKKH